MRILELRQSLRHGNLERLIVGTAVLLRSRGLDAEVLLLYNRGRARILGEDEATLPEVHPLIADAEGQGIRAWQEADRGLFSPGLLLAVLGHLRRGRYDLLHTHDVKTDVLGIIAGRLAGIPVVATAHGYPRAIWRNDVYRRLDLLALRFCKHVICVSEGLREELLGAGLDGRGLTVVNNGISASEVLSYAASAPQTLRHEVALRPEDPIIMAVGRLSSEKGHSYLLRAAHLLATKRPNLRLVIVGDGPLRASLVREANDLGIADRVCFLGFREDARALMAQCDVLVNPSLGEAFGNVALEGMVLGKPVIGSATGGMPEVIGNGETGLLVPPANAEALAAAIQKLLDDPQEARRLGERGRERVLAHFTVERMADGLAASFIAAVKGNGV